MWVFFCSFVFLIGVFQAFGSVVLIGNNVTLSFENTESNFAPLVKRSEKCGVLYAADPLDACSPLANKVISKLNDPRSPFVLIIRGGCSFEDKVRTAQAAGFRAAIVYDNENGALIAMAGHSVGINISAVFVSKHSGETLRDYANIPDMELWIVPSFQNSAWSIMGISFISLLAMCAVIVSCFFVRRHRIRRRERPRAPRVQEFHGMSSRLVNAMPSVIFTAELEDNCTSKACTICLEDYVVGEKLRILPCCHKFHANCVDTWLTSRRTFCPICKRDARSCEGNPPSSESTPLLSALVSSSPILSSISSLAPSSATEFGPSSSLPPSVPHPQPASETHFNQLCHQNTAQTVLDLSSQRSYTAFLGNYPLSPSNSRYLSPYPPGSGSYMDYVNRLP
ncbi:receptor homology region, transmembrane domain- and RING domain-containing protein 2-like [Henckelia pumila]|uniref:receptor homology region, transmembrane domain- and RING domain-containing protein 2-like n=1 Tax=Henckelia pumila TaxID=405737 RepID=UPI003C6EA2CA